MSFAMTKAGKTDDVKTAVDEEENITQYGGALGALTKQFVIDVLALQGTPGVIVEASGHSDARTTSVTVTIRPVY